VGKRETSVTDKTPTEPADLVDGLYADLVRPLGNLVILYAQAEAALLDLWVALTGCTEEEAQKFLGGPRLKVQEQIVARAKAASIADHVQELTVEIENYYNDRKQRDRLIHDEWYVSLLTQLGKPRTRGLPRKRPTEVVWGDPEPIDVWKLARRFRDYRRLFTSLSHFASRRNG